MEGLFSEFYGILIFPYIFSCNMLISWKAIYSVEIVCLLDFSKPILNRL